MLLLAVLGLVALRRKRPAQDASDLQFLTPGASVAQIEAALAREAWVTRRSLRSAVASGSTVSALVWISLASMVAVTRAMTAPGPTACSIMSTTRRSRSCSSFFW